MTTHAFAAMEKTYIIQILKKIALKLRFIQSGLNVFPKKVETVSKQLTWVYTSMRYIFFDVCVIVKTEVFMSNPPDLCQKLT